MAWIKFEKDLLSDPRLLRMAKSLEQLWSLIDTPSVTEDGKLMGVCNDAPLPSVTLVCGCLVRLWAIGDTHIREDDVLPLGAKEIDELLGVPGFCALMPADWLEPIDSKSVKLPNFHEHNGTVAKTRALTLRRVTQHRSMSRNASSLPDQTRPEETKPAESPARAKALATGKSRSSPGKRSSKAKAPSQTEALGDEGSSPAVDNSAELSVFGSGAPPVVGVDLGGPDVGLEVSVQRGGNGELVLDGEGGGDLVVDVVTGGNGKTLLQQACSATWKAYAVAYERRWGVAPLRSAKANSQVLAFCKVVPQHEAPEVAAFFVASARGVYVAGKHDLNFLSRDAAGLRTEWATGRQVMESEARQGDQTAATGNVFADLIEQGRRLEEEDKARVSAKV